MKKKIVAVGLSMALCASLFTGCSSAEISYMNTMKEFMNIEAYEGTGEISFELSEQVSKDMLGLENVSLDMDMDFVVDMDEPYMDVVMDMALTLGEDKIELPMSIVMNSESVYISKDYIFDTLDMTSSLSEIVESSVEDKEELDKLKAALKESLEGYDYIDAFSQQDMDIYRSLYGPYTDYGPYSTLPELYSEFDMEDLMDLNKDIYERVYEYIQDTFPKFTSGFVSKKGNVHTIEITPENGVDFIEELVEYIYENKEHVYAKTTELIEEIYVESEAYLPEDAPTLEEIRMAMELYEPVIFEQIDAAYEAMQDVDFDQFIDMFEGSKFTTTLAKTSKGYEYGAEIEVFADAMYYLTGMAESEEVPEIFTAKMTVEYKELDEVKEEDKIIVDSKKVLTMSEMEDIMHQVQFQLDPATEINLLWYEEDSYVIARYFSESGKDSFEMMGYYLDPEQQSLYVPMGKTIQMFGGDAGINPETNSFGFLQGDKIVDMNWTYVDGEVYVKVRDFEKLGYTVEYVDEYYNKMVTIKKP